MGLFGSAPTDKGGHLHSPSPAFERTLWRRCTDRCSRSVLPLGPGITRSVCVRPVRPISTSPRSRGRCCRRLLACADPGAPGERPGRPSRRRLGVGPGGCRSGRHARGINLPVLLWLHNPAEAWDLESYRAARYGLVAARVTTGSPAPNAEMRSITAFRRRAAAVAGD